MTASGQLLRDYTRTFFRFEPRVRPSRWCERLHLPAGKQETESGPVNFATRPYLREVLDSIDDPTVTDEVFCAPTRMGKTFTLRMAFAYSVAGDPAPMLWVDSTIDKARDVSKKELQPLIEANHLLRSRKPANRHNFTDLRMLFPGASFTMVGGNSDAQVAGDTVKRVFGNELDKWRGASDKEASIAELVRHRTESFDEERKHFWSSTPTLEELTTWTYYLRTDQRQFQVRCPDCGHLQALLWENVVWDPAAQITEHKWDLRQVKASTRYRCANPACGSHWTDAMRHLAVRHPDSHWLPTAVGQPGWRGHHLNGLYGPLKSNNLGELAVDFHTSRSTGFWSDRRDFWNSRMGMPWKENPSDLSVEKFAKLSRPYRRGEAGPAGFRPDLQIIEFDVQSYGIWYVVRTWSWAGDSYLVDHGKVGSFADLAQIQEDYRKLGGRSYVIGDIHFEDRRAETLEAIYCRRDRGWFGAEGFELLADLVRLEKANVFLGGSRQKENVTVTKLSVSTYHFKVELEKRFTGEILNWFVYSLQTELLGATETELEEQREYFTQLLDERRVPRKRMLAGKPAFEFRSRNKNNHFFDCAVYGMALFWVLSKNRSYSPRSGGAGERKTVEVST
jgi:hypothetical protein